MAHGIGSKDLHIHASMIFQNKDGQCIPTLQCGNGELKIKTHVYVNKEEPQHRYHALPIEYKKAIDKHTKSEGRLHHVGKA